VREEGFCSTLPSRHASASRAVVKLLRLVERSGPARFLPGGLLYPLDRQGSTSLLSSSTQGAHRTNPKGGPRKKETLLPKTIERGRPHGMQLEGPLTQANMRKIRSRTCTGHHLQKEVLASRARM
jgi:hypothetical protein